MPRAHGMAVNDTRMEWCFLHSLKSSSNSPGSGSFPSYLETSSAISKMLLFMGLTVYGFVSLMSPGTVWTGTHIQRPCIVWVRMRRRMPRTKEVAGRGGRLKPPNRIYYPKTRPTRNISVEKRTGGSHRLSPGQRGGWLLGTSPFHGGTSTPTCSRRICR